MVVTPRDLEMLRALKRFRCLTSRQVTALHFMHIELCRRRMRKLERAGLVQHARRPTTNTGRPENVYSLNRDGARLVLGDEAEGLSRYARVPSSYFYLEHRLGINDVLIAFVIACRNSTYSCEFLTEDEIRAAVPHRHAVVPDGVISLQNRQDKRSLLYVEYDRGTESLKSRSRTAKTIKSKLISYADLLASRTYLIPHNEAYAYAGFRVLWVAPNEARCRSMQDLASAHHYKTLFWFTTQENVKAGILGPIWWTGAGGDALHALVRDASKQDEASQRASVTATNREHQDTMKVSRE